MRSGTGYANDRDYQQLMREGVTEFLQLTLEKNEFHDITKNL